MNTKAEKYNKFLQENKVTCFQYQEIQENALHPVLYRTFMEINGQNLPVMLVIDDSIYVMLQVRVGSALVKDANKVAVLDYVNKLNENYKVFKYYVPENGDIVIESCIPVSDTAFEAQMIHAVIDVILNHLNEEYPKLMKVVWAD